MSTHNICFHKRNKKNVNTFSVEISSQSEAVPWDKLILKQKNLKTIFHQIIIALE